MTKWTIYTEKKRNLTKLVSKYFDSATFIKAQGIYKGKAEMSIVIEVIELDDFWYANSCRKVHHLVSDINTVNKQECCLLTEEKLRANLI